VVLQPCLLRVGSVLVADFLRVAEVVPIGFGRVPELLLVGSVPVVGFLRVAVVVTAKMATPTKVDSKLSDAHLESLKR